MSQLPGDTSLPLFVYGALKPGEISWPLLEPFADSHETARLDDFSIYLIDGMPMAKHSQGKSLSGHIVTLKNPMEAYRAIAAFENVGEYYLWQTVVVDHAYANALVAITGEKNKGVQLDYWSTEHDPYFAQLIPMVFEKISPLRTILRGSSLGWDAEYIRAFLEVQSLYLLLWAMLERLYLFRVGYSDKKLKDKVDHIQQLDEWRKAFNAAEIVTKRPAQTHSQVRHPRHESEEPTGFADWLKVRNNIAHRGKGNQNEVKFLLRITIDMHNTLAILLQEISPSVRDLWLELTNTKKQEHTGRLYVIQQKGR